jgi:NhaP-type Na+/H+ or K+/H+ antiporter
VEPGLNTGALAVVAGCFVIWGLVSSRFERRNVSAPIAFVALGLLVAHQPFSLIHVTIGSASFRGIAEVTLAVVLFTDASRVNVRALRADAAIPLRLLLVGLPLTIGLGTAAALVVFGGVNPWVAAVIGAAVAPTDAALGAQIMEDHRVPGRIRRILNVESGLNDGIATPFVNVFIVGAVGAELAHGGRTVASAAGQLGIGIITGAGLGLAVGAAFQLARNRGWAAGNYRHIGVLALAFLTYALAIEAGGNGFVGAFAGGLAFGSAAPAHDADSDVFITDVGELLSLIVWFLFGAVMIVPAIRDATWRDGLYALLALTVVRMLPVAISLWRSGLSNATTAFVGWFGPRGLASVVFALLAFDALDKSDRTLALPAISLTVLLSVLAHGVTASPLAARYGKYAESLKQHRPEQQPAERLRTRRIRGRLPRLTR